ncbi:sensor histidine kinase [Chelativorans salis]|uniref:histidine kinase n=1 Tax=Chelativorans salis TaxID=2978478 RepID=A0ABT2LSA4_9HYPH|nr:sensor histidine kinase [Chelativorans sp. EGI FJ00035]MCT7376054.1 sensor histidine kinase [Chelativorans sp. EGI FJ00035]
MVTFRVVAFSSIWAVIALVVIATVISALFRQVSNRGFEEVLSAHLFNLIASVSASEAGSLVGSPNLGDLRFSEPLSGWYWSVEPASEALRNPLRSPSLVGTVPSPPQNVVPFSREFQRTYLAKGPGGEDIQVLEAEIVLDEADRIARFRVMGNRSELEREIADFAQQLFVYLAIFGLGMVAINAFAILIALRPLQGIRQALASIRAGTAERLSGPFPGEIAPLADETNALIESNRRIIERSRKQVGNLAHSLKTPLAVLMNEGRAMGGGQGTLISTQASAMQQQIDHYLQRARAAAQRSALAQRSPVNETLARMVRVTEKLNPEKELTVRMPEEAVVFAGEREDLEEIAGNLLENAMKWARGRVTLSLHPPQEEGDERSFRIIVEDDGPGIPEDQARQALKRGRRLDETKPGTGLGLAIVADLVGEYGGGLSLERSQLGGLRAEVTLLSA